VLLDRAGLALDGPAWDGADHDLATELLAPSVIYAPAVLALLDAVDVHGLVHITGGGLPGNIPRILPDGTAVTLDTSTWWRPRIFDEIQRLGGVADDEMARTFNLGVGMVAVVPAADAEAAVASLTAAGHDAAVIGEVTPGDRSLSLT